MEQMINLFEEFLMKAITMTENFIEIDLEKDFNFENFTDNRERLFLILDQTSLQIDWSLASSEKKQEINRRIEYIIKLDEKVLTKLQEHQQELKREIERTVRQKDNIKGYNLNDVK